MDCTTVLPFHEEEGRNRGLSLPHFCGMPSGRPCPEGSWNSGVLALVTRLCEKSAEVG